MRYRNLAFLLIGLIFISCGQRKTETDSATDDKAQLSELVINALKWHDKNSAYDGFEPVYNSEGLAVGMDLDILEKELDRFTESNLFDKEFIDNYSKIVRTIDKQIKSKELVFTDEDMPPYGGADPWCNCQDIPYENPWDDIIFDFLSLDSEKATFKWTWGDPTWDEYFTYLVEAKKTNETWKITYLEGFDFKLMTE